MLYITLRSHWCDVLLIVHAPTEDKCDEMKDSVCEEMKCVFDHFLKYHMKILLGNFSAKAGKKKFSNQHSGMRVYEISNDNRVKVVNLATSLELLMGRHIVR
jgi:hypothetical protein